MYKTEMVRSLEMWPPLPSPLVRPSELSNVVQMLPPASHCPASAGSACSELQTGTETFPCSCSLRGFWQETDTVSSMPVKEFVPNSHKMRRKSSQHSPCHSSTCHVALTWDSAVSTWTTRQRINHTDQEHNGYWHSSILVGSWVLAHSNDMSHHFPSA